MCHGCNKCKPFSEFHKCSRRRDGLQSQCKTCTAQHNARYYQRNKERCRQARTTYYRAHKEESKACCKSYYEAHKEAKLEYDKQYRRTHRKEHNAWKQKWRAQNKDKVASYQRKARRTNPVYYEKYRLRKVIRQSFDAKGKGESPVLLSVCKCTRLELYQHLCATWQERYGTPYQGEECEIDHIIPLKEAATLDEVHELFYYKNLQLLTQEDNRQKG